ncbi:putative porin [Cycloclasticus pugetii]|jgi:hypothetical protein|uniref:putative porin n=1 Tax=Cycloclasticus pugetii TaxID=34068 RepID=UPI000916397C|nr:putative porin [Cycloclasticus pugetii]SHJ59356.1 Putative porin [Cycloclasticus pugetii]
MKQTKLSVAIKATLLGASIVLAPASFAVDKELLDILKANGAITEDQYTELSMSNMMNKQNKPSDEMLKKMAWAGKIKVKGDLRLRNENRSTTNGVSDKGRQRYRARIGVYADITKNVKGGIRLATGDSEGPTSTNETINDRFDRDDVWVDLAYINWEALNGLELIGGKFKQPWEQVSGGMVWDSDLNPEGGALRYTTALGGVDIITTAGVLLMDDGGSSKDDDSTVNFGQIATKFKLAGAKTKLGVSVFDYSLSDELQYNLTNSVDTTDFLGKGNDSTEYQLTEVFGETNLDLGLPVKLYGHYVKNNDADGINSGEDTAWLLGVGTKMGKWKASYDYREVELNSVFAAFNDSDFADGYTDSEGSRWKLSYEINKNFSVGTTYLDTEMGKLTSKGEGDVDTWQIDLVAKF